MLEPFEMDPNETTKESKEREEDAAEDAADTTLPPPKPPPLSSIQIEENGSVREAKIITFKGIPRPFRKEFMGPITPALVKEKASSV